MSGNNLTLSTTYMLLSSTIYQFLTTTYYSIFQDGNVDCDFTNENPEAIGKSNVVDATTDDVHDAESIAETSALLSADLSQQSPVHHVSVDDDDENEKCDLNKKVYICVLYATINSKLCVYKNFVYICATYLLKRNKM